MIISKTKVISYIVVLIVGFLLGVTLTCSSDKDINSVQTKIKVVERKETVEIEKPVVEYKYVDREKIVVINDTVKEQYRYTFKQKEKFGDIEIKGWGDIDNIKVTTTHKDSIIEKTIIKHLKGVYLTGEYNNSFNKDNPLQGFKIGLDYINKDITIGGNIGYFEKTPIFGIRIGYKL